MFTNGRALATRSRRAFRCCNFDPGPRSGNFPTDPMLVNGPDVNHAAIDALFPPGRDFATPARSASTTLTARWPASRQYSLGYERQIGSTIGLSVDYIRSEQRNQYVLQST